jgi:hypothetical protein
MSELRFGCAMTFLLLWNPSSVTPQQEQGFVPAVEAREELLGEKGPETDPGDEHDKVSRDGRRVAWRERQAKGWAAKVNGVPRGESYQDIKNLRFSRDGQRFSFKAKEGKRWLFVIDGEPGEAYDEVSDLTFSSDGRRYAYRSKYAERWGMVVDGEGTMKLLGENTFGGIYYDELGPPRFSADGRHLAYRIKKSKKEMIVLDGKEGPTYEEVGDPMFSTDGQHMIYPAKRNKRWVVVADGQDRGPELKAVWLGDLIFNNRVILTGLSWAQFHPEEGLIYVGRLDEGWSPIIGGQTALEFDAVTWPVFFGGDHHRVAYAGAEVKTGFGGGAKGIGRVIVDGEAGPAYEGKSTKSLGRIMLEAAGGMTSYDQLAEGVAPFNVFRYGVSSPETSPDGQHIAYAARRDDDDYVVVRDGEVGPSYKSIACGPEFTPEGTLVFVGIEEDKLVLVKNGERASEFMWKDADCTGLWTPGGNHVVYIASQDDQMRVFVDGNASEQYEAKGIDIETGWLDGELHVAYAVRGKKDKGDAFVVADGKQGKRYDQVYALRILDDGTIAYVGRQERKFFRVSQPLRQRPATD